VLSGSPGRSGGSALARRRLPPDRLDQTQRLEILIDGNYPNPFNPRTTLRFTSASAGRAEIRIFGVGGRLVRVLRARVQEGANEVGWDGRSEDGRGAASGVYFYTIQFPDAKSLPAPSHLVIVK
jgi:hypothetical protein